MTRPKWFDDMEMRATKALDDILKEIDEDRGPSMVDIADSVTELDEEKIEASKHVSDITKNVEKTL